MSLVGTDDLFKKRKAKTALDHARRKPVRAEYDKVLIVCEGEKTEPNYFLEIVDYYELSTANVCVDGDCGSDPVSVVDHAIDLYNKESASGEPYDRVYCVIDRDAHPKFAQALDKIAAQRPNGVFHDVVSVPCFEYWLLLHFTYSTAAYTAVGGKSAGDRVSAHLHEFWPEYTKGKDDVFKHLFDQLGFAKSNAARCLGDAERTGSHNPSTSVHVLVDYLQNLKTQT